MPDAGAGPRLSKLLRGLFESMSQGGLFGTDDILHFNGGLFADAERATRYAGLRVREFQMQRELELKKARAASVGQEREELERRWAELLATHGLPSLKITEAAQWISKREAFLQRTYSAN